MHKEQYKLLYKNIDHILNQIQDNNSQILKHEKLDLVNSLLYILVIEAKKEKGSAFTTEQSLDIKDRFDRYNNIQCRDFEHIRIGNIGYFWSRDGFYFFKFDNVEAAGRCPNLRSFLTEQKFKYDKARHVWFVKRFYSLNTINFTLDMFLEVMTERLKLDSKVIWEYLWKIK